MRLGIGSLMNPISNTQSLTPILFTHYGDNGIRGSERCLLDLLAHLNRAKYQPIVWCNADAFAKEVKKLGISVYQSQFTILFGWNRPKFDFGQYRQLLNQGSKIVKKHNIKLLHANSGAPNQWLVPIAKTHQIPLITHLHCRYVFRDRVLLKLHSSDINIGVSKHIIELLNKDGISPEKLKTVANGIDQNRLENQPIQNIRKQINASEKDFVLITIGALVKDKGVDLLINAMQILITQNIDAKLIIYGSGPEKEALSKQINQLALNKHVFLMGQNNTVFGVMKGTADLYVSGTRDEAFGLVFAEAGLAGLASVAPRIGGIPSVIKEDKTGIMVEPDNANEIATAVTYFIKSPKLRKTMESNAKLHIQRNFTIQKNADAIQNIYDQALNQPLSPKGCFRITILLLVSNHIKKWLASKFKALYSRKAKAV